MDATTGNSEISMLVHADTFCVGPWAEIRVNSNGSLNYCHYADNTSLPLDDSVAVLSLDNYFSKSQTIIDVRNSLATGLKTPRCHRCYHEESIDCISFRHRRNIQFGIFPGADFDQSLIESDFFTRFETKSKPRFYHVSFSNLCNMACMMCHSKDSTRFDDFVRRAGLSNTMQPVRNDWTQGPAWHEFCEHLINNPDIICLHIMGGEPMYHKRFRELLKFLTDHHHTDFHFTFVTNGTIYDENIFEYLAQFRSVTIEISIEGFGPENDYVRHGSDTQKIVENLHSFLAHRSSILDVVLRTVPQALTVMQYHKILEFCRKHNVTIDSNPLSNPDFLHCSVLPIDMKKRVQQSLEKFMIPDNGTVNKINLRNRNNVHTALSTNAKFVLKHLFQDPINKKSMQQLLVDYCTKWDRTRRYHIKDYIPELSDFFQEYGYSV